MRMGANKTEILVSGKATAEEFRELLGCTLYFRIRHYGEELADSDETFSCMFAVAQVTMTVSTHHRVLKAGTFFWNRVIVATRGGTFLAHVILS